MGVARSDRPHDDRKGELMSPAGVSSPSDRADAGCDVSFAARLAPDRVAAATARRKVRLRLGQLVEPAMLDDVLLVVSELVTNAVRHGCGDVELHVVFDGRCVTGHVRDEGQGFAHGARRRSPDQVGGHGLRLVEVVAAGWGVRDGSAHVWFEIAEQHPTAAPHMT